MDRIAHRELRNNSSEVLRRVAAGESFEITNHGTVVAVLRPPSRVMELSIVKPATRRGGWLDLEPVSGNGRSTEEVLDELREDRV